ncbi:hypothetical protein [Aeribacillus pallidus]|uniref:hypothetical protein n=1 Tax=Aeribacillus pallidus TaxID=33936 RepID=UPI003D1D1B2B
MMFKKKDELTKNREELALIEGTLSELRDKLGKYQTLLRSAQLELELEGSASDIKKRIKRFEGGIKKIEAEIAEHQQRANQLQAEIDAELERQRLEKLDKAVKEFEGYAYRHHRISLLRNELTRLTPVVESKTGLIDYQPLRKLYGLRYGEEFRPEHQEGLDKCEEASKRAREKAEKEVASLIAQIKEIVGL